MSRQVRRGVALMALVLVLGGCSGSSDDTPDASATAAPTSTVTPGGGAATGTARPSIARTGVLVRDNPGMPPGRWFLLYEEPGAPALTLELAITSATRCLEDTKVARCDALIPGTRVRVDGTLDGDRLAVTILEVLEAPSSAP
jgi:hypothetical protein